VTYESVSAVRDAEAAELIRAVADPETKVRAWRSAAAQPTHPTPFEP
jgi:hypothetical protein